MKKRKKVLVVLGGLSREREVSLKSGRACIKAIKKLGHYVKTLDPKNKPLNQINKNQTDIIFTHFMVNTVRMELLKVISNI